MVEPDRKLDQDFRPGAAIPLPVREAPQGSTWGADVLQLPGLDLVRAFLGRRAQSRGSTLDSTGFPGTGTWRLRAFKSGPSAADAG